MIPIRYLLITVLLGMIALFQHAARADERSPLPRHANLQDYPYTCSKACATTAMENHTGWIKFT